MFSTESENHGQKLSGNSKKTRCPVVRTLPWREMAPFPSLWFLFSSFPLNH